MRQPPPQKHGSGTRKRAGSKHTRGATNRLLPPSHREELFDLAYFKYKRVVEQKKESIYSTYFDGSDDGKSGPAESREARDGTA